MKTKTAANGIHQVVLAHPIGQAAAERIRQELLDTVQKHGKIAVLFNDPTGYSPRSLDRVFGGLIRNNGKDKKFFEDYFVLEAADWRQKDYVSLAKRYVDLANEKYHGATA